MTDFDYWDKLYKNEHLDKFNLNPYGELWLKTKSIMRKEILADFLMLNHLSLEATTLQKQFEELYSLLCNDVGNSHRLLNSYSRIKNANQLSNLDINQLVSELYKLRNFDWGGDYQNSLDKYLVSRYVKIYSSYETLLSKFETEINPAVQGYVLNSWYNHWSSILIEHIFKSHPVVLPTVGQIKSVDFFVCSSTSPLERVESVNVITQNLDISYSNRYIPFDLKVTYLPNEYIYLKRREKGFPVELTYLKQKAKEASIFFDKEAHPSVIYHEIIEKMKDRNDSFCRSVLQTLKNEKLQILKEAQNNPKILAKWLYENQGEMRFGSENRIFLVLVDADDFNNSWKLKRSFELLKPAISGYLDNFQYKNIENLKVTFNYKNKPHPFTALADVIFVVRGDAL